MFLEVGSTTVVCSRWDVRPDVWSAAVLLNCKLMASNSEEGSTRVVCNSSTGALAEPLADRWHARLSYAPSEAFPGGGCLPGAWTAPLM